MTTTRYTAYRRRSHGVGASPLSFSTGAFTSPSPCALHPSPLPPHFSVHCNLSYSLRVIARLVGRKDERKVLTSRGTLPVLLGCLCEMPPSRARPFYSHAFADPPENPHHAPHRENGEAEQEWWTHSMRAWAKSTSLFVLWYGT